MRAKALRKEIGDRLAVRRRRTLDALVRTVLPHLAERPEATEALAALV